MKENIHKLQYLSQKIQTLVKQSQNKDKNANTLTISKNSSRHPTLTQNPTRKPHLTQNPSRNTPQQITRQENQENQENKNDNKNERKLKFYNVMVHRLETGK